MFTSKVQFGYPCPRGGGQPVQAGLSCPLPRIGSGSVISQFLLHHNLGIFSCERCEHYFSQTEMFTSNIQFGYPCPRGGGRMSRLVYLAPCTEFGSGSIIRKFLLHHNLGIFSCERCDHYFSQTEMFTSNIQFGYPCPKGWGQAVQAGLSCPGFGSGSVICQFLLCHHLGIFSCKRCEHYLSQTSNIFQSN